MKIFELIIDKLDELTGVDAVALVENPAIQADFFAFKQTDIEDAITLNIIKQAIKENFVDRIPGESKEDYMERCVPKLRSEGYDQDQSVAICLDTFDLDVTSLPDYTNEIKEEKRSFTDNNAKFTFSLNEDQQMVVGPLMIPNKLIFRVDENGDPYYVFFSEDTIKDIAEKLMREKYIDKINLEHNPDETVNGYMVSTWIIEDELKDKQQVYGFNFPKGTWMGQYKIEDKSVWEKVKAGEIKGFSVEGFFGDKFIQAKNIPDGIK